MAAYLSVRRRLASRRPPSDSSVHEMPTKRQPFYPLLLAEMLIGSGDDTRAAARARVATETRRRRDDDRETLDRGNPFLTPSPHAPWAPASDAALPAAPVPTLPPPPDDDAAFAAAPTTRARMRMDRVGIMVAVWAMIVALALFAFVLRG